MTILIEKEDILLKEQKLLTDGKLYNKILEKNGKEIASICGS